VVNGPGTPLRLPAWSDSGWRWPARGREGCAWRRGLRRTGLALQQCLPPELFAAFQATCGQTSGAGGDYGYAAVAASARAEAKRGTLRNPLLSWLYRRVARA
jgi:hypothetical protein